MFFDVFGRFLDIFLKVLGVLKLWLGFLYQMEEYLLSLGFLYQNEEAVREDGWA